MGEKSMKKTFIKSTLIILTLFAFVFTSGTRVSKTWAKETEMSQSASKEKPITSNDENEMRKSKLVSFLKKHQSPFIEEIDEIISVSQNCGVKPELMIAISGVESTFGQNYPVWSNNPLGWGIYGNQILSFPSLGKAFEAAACGIAQKYPADIQENIERLGVIYNGVTPTAWSSKIRFFLKKIEESSPNVSSLALDI